MKLKKFYRHADLTGWNFDDDFAKCLKPLISEISKSIDKEFRENLEIHIEDRFKDGPFVCISIPLDDGDDTKPYWAEIPLDDIFEERLQQSKEIVKDSREIDDLQDWVKNLRRYLAQFEKALHEAGGLIEAAEEIERPATGPNLVAHMMIDGKQHDAPLTKVADGYEVTIPAAGVLKLPVLIEKET